MLRVTQYSRQSLRRGIWQREGQIARIKTGSIIPMHSVVCWSKRPIEDQPAATQAPRQGPLTISPGTLRPAKLGCCLLRSRGMEKVNIICGEEYAFREVRGTKCTPPTDQGTPAPTTQQMESRVDRAQSPGLVDSVESAQIIVPWKQRKAYLRDEENAAGLVERNKADGFQPGSPITEAVQQVFEAAGDEVDFYRHELLCSTWPARCFVPMRLLV